MINDLNAKTSIAVSHRTALETAKEFDRRGEAQRALAAFKQAHANGQLQSPSARRFVAALATSLGDHRFARQMSGGRQPRRFWGVWVALGVALLVAVGVTAIRTPPVFCTAPVLSTFCAPETFLVQVRVTDEASGSAIAGAAVSLELGGQAPYRTVTDSEGVGLLEVSANHNARPGLITVGAKGFKTSNINITIHADTLPLTVQLQPTP